MRQVKNGAATSQGMLEAPEVGRVGSRRAVGKNGHFLNFTSIPTIP